MPAPSRQHSLALPPTLSPEALDALPELASILLRLRPPQSNSSLAGASSGGGAPGSTPGPSSSQLPGSGGVGVGGHPITGTTPATASAAAAAATPRGTSGAAVTTAGGGDGGGALSSEEITIKDLPHATDALKHKLQRARAQIKTLPDMGRSIEEQEETIADLERTIQMQQEVLAGLRSVGEQFGEEEEGGDRMEM